MLKRMAVLLLSALMLVTAVTPALANTDRLADVGAAIQLAKQYFPETNEFTSFYSTVETYEGNTIYTLYWQGKGTEEERFNESLTVRVDGNRNLVIGYSRDRSDSRKAYPALPALSESQAKSAAEAFLQKLVPLQFASTVLDQVEKPSVIVGKRTWHHTYGLSYVHQVNDIPFRSNNIRIWVNADTGEVASFAMNWQEHEFPSPEGIIDLTEAGEAFAERGLKLMYLRSYSYRIGQSRPYLAYVLEEGYQLQIDAFTGEIHVGYTLWTERTAKEAAPPGLGDKSEGYYTEYELKEIDLLEGLLTAAQAEVKVRELLNLPAEFQMSGSSLYRDYNDESLRFWNISWYVEREEYHGYASARVDASTGAVLSFSFSEKEPGVDKEDLKLTPAAAEALAREFLQKAAPAEYALSKLSTEYELDPRDPLLYSYGFSFERLYNGIPVQGDNLHVTVRYDARITGFWVNWYSGELPSSAGIMSEAAMTQHFIDSFGFELEYVLRYEASAYSAVKPSKANINLVYRPVYLNTYNFDPRTGQNLDWQGNIAVSAEKPVYNDVAGHWAAADINLLVDLGLLRLAGDSFRPDEGIALGDLLKMLADASGWGDNVIILPSAYAEYQDSIYAKSLSFGFSRGLFGDTEDIDPNAKVTREIFAFYLAKMMGHGQTASLKGIWTAPFADFRSVNAEYQGSVAVVYAEGVMSGDGTNFMPKAITTRAHVAATLANMLRMD